MKRRRTQQQAVILSPVTQSVLVSPKEESGGIFERQRFQLTSEEDGGKHSTVLFATRTHSPSQSAQKFAIKKQIINSPYNIADKSYRELFILQQLNKLKYRKDYFPGDISFVGFVDWFKAKEDEQYMHYVLERADFTLADLKIATLVEYKCILFQILFALYVAQTEYEFMHNDLHKRNVLLVRPAKGREMEYNSFKDEDVTWFTTGLSVKITDFGLSRLRLDNKRLICDQKRLVFDPNQDVEQVFNEFKSIKIFPESWVTVEEIEAEQKRLGKPDSARDDIKAKLAKEKQKQLTELRKLQRNAFTLKSLIHHDFFVSLRERKPDFMSPQQKRRKLGFQEKLEQTNERDSDFLKVSPEGSPEKKFHRDDIENVVRENNATTHLSPYRSPFRSSFRQSPYRSNSPRNVTANNSPYRSSLKRSPPRNTTEEHGTYQKHTLPIFVTADGLNDSPSFRNRKRTLPPSPSHKNSPSKILTPSRSNFTISPSRIAHTSSATGNSFDKEEVKIPKLNDNNNNIHLPVDVEETAGVLRTVKQTHPITQLRNQRKQTTEPLRRSARLQTKQPR